MDCYRLFSLLLSNNFGIKLQKPIIIGYKSAWRDSERRAGAHFRPGHAQILIAHRPGAGMIPRPALAKVES
jgi:hypothetical protein